MASNDHSAPPADQALAGPAALGLVDSGDSTSYPVNRRLLGACRYGI